MREGWPQREAEPEFELRPPLEQEPRLEREPEARPQPEAEPQPEPEAEPAPDPEPAAALAPPAQEAEAEVEVALPEPEVPVGPEEEPAEQEEVAEAPEAPAPEHAAGRLGVPDGYEVLEGWPLGERRTVGVVVGRFNGAITEKLLASALEALEAAGVARDAILVVPVPGAFELPLAAMALAKTRRYACVVALGCVIRGETPHFDLVASEAASGLQLAAIETGVPVSFGVLTTENVEQAEARVGKGAEAARSALEMADLFAQLRAAAAAAR